MTLLDQVRATIAQHKLFERGDTVVVGVSGGPDSLALLHCLRALRGELQIALHVAHLNHQLRGAAADADAEFVAWLAREWNLPATIQARDVAAYAREQRLSIEEAARQARYAFLAEVAQRIGARVLAVAHNADDQVETVVMHLVRGAGLAGLRGMSYEFKIQNSKFKIPKGGLEFRTLNFELRIARPLLHVTRAEIEQYCQANALTPRFDRSNLDTTLFRNRLRHEVLPYLETLNPNVRQILLRTARVLADDYDFLQTQVRAAFARVARERDGAIIFALDAWRALPPALQRGALRAAVQQLRSDLRNLDWTHIEDARRVALEKSTGAQATLPRGLMLTLGYDEFVIADAARVLPPPDLPLLQVERVALPAQGVTALPDSDWVVETQIAPAAVIPSEAKNLQASETLRSAQGDNLRDRWSAVFDWAKCRGEICLRRRRAGDRFQPAGLRGHTQSLAEFMLDAKIPRAVRARLPILATDNHILWVCGWRVDERARVTQATRTRTAWRVTFRKNNHGTRTSADKKHSL
jgi:tRNA(Ile)-lysidine synthase